jgi:hypothetical protein
LIRLSLFLSVLLVSLSSVSFGQERRFGFGRGGESWRSDPSIPAVLVKAIDDQNSEHYEGRLTREFERGPQNLKHDEIVFRDGPLTRIEFPTGSKYSGQIIVENVRERRYYMPDKNEIYIFPSRREENFVRLTGLARRADRRKIFLSEAPGERIAGISTEQVVVRDLAGTVTQRMFIDPRSGVVLKREVFDALGRETGYFVFTQINLRPGRFEASLFRLERPGARVVTAEDTLREVAAREGFTPVNFGPSTGYRLEAARVANIEQDRVLVESFVSKRGRLTLFELRSAVSPERLKRVAHGEVQVYSWEKDGKWFVLFGPRTEGELVQLAQTLSNGTP